MDKTNINEPILTGNDVLNGNYDGKQKQILEIAEVIAKYISSRDFEVKFITNPKSKAFPFSHTAGVAEDLYNAGYRKIPEGAVVLTDKELNEELDTIKCAMIVHDDDGEKYVSLDDYNEYTERLGKIARQRKVRIEQLEKLLDDKCDRCIERERKETAEKFAERLKKQFTGVRTYEYRDTGTAWGEPCIGGLINNKIDEICKELIGG